MTSVTAQFTADVWTQGDLLVARFTWSGATTCNADPSNRVYFQIRFPDGSYAASGYSSLAAGSAQLTYQTGTSSPTGTWTAAIQAYNNTSCTVSGATYPASLVSSSTYYISLSMTPTGTAGTITSSPVGTPPADPWHFPVGTVVTLTAHANSGYTFNNWSGGVVGTSTSIQITMNSDKFVTANFVATGGTAKGTLILNDTNNPTNFYGVFTPGVFSRICDLYWQNTGGAGTIFIRCYYQNPTTLSWVDLQAQDVNGEIPNFIMSAGQKGYDSFNAHIPADIPLTTTKFAVRIWGDGETMPSLMLTFGGSIYD